MFEVVFDYGDHGEQAPRPEPDTGSGRAAPTRSPPTGQASRSAPTGAATAS